MDEPVEKDGKKDIMNLLSALNNGRVYIAQEYFREAKGFSFFLYDKNRKVTMGDDFFLKSRGTLQVRLPEPGKIRVIKDGQVFRERVSQGLECAIDERGVYRVEVYLERIGKYRPWIFSNPVYVKYS
jgi:hypothetical protein